MKIKNKIIIILLSFFIFSNLLGFSHYLYNRNDIITVSAVSYSGSGTYNNPYKITNISEYNAMAEDISSSSAEGDYYSIEFDDIDGANINQIESNYANLNFNFNTISGAQKGIVKYNYGTIEKLLIDDTAIWNVEAKEYQDITPFYTTGAIADINEGNIYYCGVTNSAICMYDFNGFSAIGGISGISSGTIEQCYVYNTGLFIDAHRTNQNQYYAAGGIVGYHIGGDIDTCISIGNFFYEDSTGMGIGLREARLSSGGYRYFYLSRLRGGIFGLSNPSEETAHLAAGVAANSEYLLYSGVTKVKNCYSDYKDFSWSNVGVSVEYDYTKIPGKAEDGYITTITSYTEIYDLCIGGYAYGSYLSDGTGDADTYSNNYSKYDLSDKNTIWLDISQLDTSQYDTVAEALAPTSVLGLYPEDGWVIPSSTSDNNGYPYLKYYVPTATLRYNYINVDDGLNTYTDDIILTNSGSGWESVNSLSSYFTNSSTVIPSNSNGNYKLLGYFLKNTIRTRYCSTYSYNSNTYSKIYTATKDTGALALYGTALIVYSGGSYSLEIWEGDVEHGGTYELCPIYLFQEVSYNVTVVYNKVSNLNSGTPNINVTCGGTTTSMSYPTSSTYTSADFTTTTLSVDFAFSSTYTTSAQRGYFVFWRLYYGAASEGTVIKTSLGSSSDLTSSNIGTIRYDKIGKNISWNDSGYTNYIIHIQILPAIPISLNANGGTGTTKTVYALPGEDFIFDNGTTGVAAATVPSFTKSDSTLTGFSSSSTSTSLVLDNSLGIVGDGTYFNSSTKVLKSTNGSTIEQTGFTLYAVWVQKVIEINVTHKVQGTSTTLGTTSITLDYVNGGNKEFVGTFSGYEYAEDYEQTSKSISTAPDLDVSGTYIYVDSGLYEDFTGKITYALTAYYKKVEEDSGTEEPDTTEEYICNITIVYDGTGESEVYTFYIDGSVSTNLSSKKLGYGATVYYNIPTGYAKNGNATASGQYIATFINNYIGDSFTTASSVSSVFIDGEIYNVTITVPCTETGEETVPGLLNVTVKFQDTSGNTIGESWFYAIPAPGMATYEGMAGYEQAIAAGYEWKETCYPSNASTYLDMNASTTWKLETLDPLVAGSVTIIIYFEMTKTVNINVVIDYNITYTTFDGQKKTLTPTSSETLSLKKSDFESYGEYWYYTDITSYDFSGIPTVKISSCSPTSITSQLSIDNQYSSYVTLDIDEGVLDLTSTSFTVKISCTGTLKLKSTANYTENKTVKVTGVYYKGFVNENIKTGSLTCTSTSGYYDESQVLYEKTFNGTITAKGTYYYVTTAAGNISAGFDATSWSINSAVLTTLKNMATVTKDNVQIKYLTKPNGYLYSDTNWAVYDSGKIAVTFNSYISDEYVEDAVNNGKIVIYQNWQYASYQVTINKNKYTTGLSTFSYKAGEDFSVTNNNNIPTELNGYNISGWYITSATLANNDSDYNIYTSKGYINSSDESWMNNPKNYLLADYIYNTNLMYGNFTIEPIFDTTGLGPQNLIFDFGITNDEYNSGHSDEMVYTGMTFDEANVTYILEDIDINDSINLSEILNEVYLTIPKFYQNTTTNTKYYLVGWTGSSYSGEYKSSNLDKIYLYDGGVIPGNVVTDSVVYDDGGNLIGGKIYAVWAKLYEIRVALLEDATTGQETSLYNGSDLVQRGNDLKVEEPWQDNNANYYTFFYGETLENNPEVILYFDLNTAIGKIPNTNGYSLSYKHNENFASLEDVSLRTLSGYRIYGLINTTTYYVNSTGSSVTTSSSEANYTSYDVEDATKKVEFKSLISKLINYSTSKGTMGTIITIEPIWEEVKFNVVVNGDKNIDLDVIKNYSETFTVSATGAFDVWPKDANINATTYDGWYFDYLTDASTDKNESEGKKWTQTISNGKTTNLPIGTDFYNKILKVNNGTVSNVYTISVEENSSDILNLTLKFNAHYIGAVYMLQIYHINAQGKTISNLEILESENILDWVYDETSGKENVEDILVAGFNTNGGTTVNYSTTSLLSLLKKYSFSGSFTSKTYGIDNSEAFANYPYKLYRNGTNYFLTLQDKASFEEELLQEKANMQAGYYSLDFYDYASTSTTNTSTSYNHLCYDIGAMSIELNGTTKQFTEDSKYSDAFVVNYNNGKCDWQFNSNNISYSSAKKIYARWVRKIYDLNMSVKFEENDSNSGYLVAEVNDGTTTSYYAYVYITNETTGESSYKLYSIPNATTFKNYNFYGNWITNSNVKEIGTTLEVPAGSVVTISAYDQSEDINSDAMLGYRFNSVDILNPYTTTEFTCNVGDNTYITYSGCVEDANSKTCNYISTTTGTLSKYYIYSTGDKTIFDFTDSEMNKAFETHDRINLEANLEKIIYTLTGSIDSKYGSLSYEYSKGSQYGIYNFTLTDILVGDSLTVKYSSPLGYKLDGWNFVNSNGKSSNLATTSLIWTDGRVANSQLIDATFLRKYAYKDLTSYPTTANQVLGELTPKTSLIDFNINVTILNNVTKDRLEQFTITSTSQFVKLNDGTTVNLGGSYELIINPTNRTSYACYVNGSDYAVLKMYIADKNSKVVSYIDYDFPVTSLDSLEFDLSTQFLDSLVQYTQGIPVVEDNRYINVLILVSEVITINSSDDTVLKENTDTYDIKYGIRQLSANGVVIASGENNKYITKQNTQYAYVGQKVKFEINALDSKYYSGAQITVNQNGLTSEYTLKSAGNCEVTLTENTTVTVKFIPATLDLVVNLMYRGVTYEASRYAELMNLSNIQILTKALDYSISDENGTLRTIKFFYGDIFTLVFNKNNFNSQFIVNDVLTEFEYRVLVNGQQIYEENDKYSSVLTKSTNVIIDIIDLTQNTVKVQTNMNNCGVIYGVSKSNIVKAIGDSQQEFMLYSGDTLTIYLDVATGYNFVNYSYNEEKSVVLIEETEGEYAGFYKFTLIEDYNSTLSGVYTLNFELITFDVELCYVVDGEVNNDAGSGYQLSSSTANINSEITVSNISTSKLANAGYKFIGYTIGQTYIDGQELYAGGSYYVTIDFADYAQYINTSNVLVIYINFIRQYQISVEVSGNDYEQTKVSLYESDVAKFENYSNTKLPWMSSYLDSSNYSKQVYKLVVDTKNETGMYFVSLSLNGNLIEISEENVLKKSVNNNVSALEYTFNLTSNEFTTYEFKITYMPEKLTTTLKEYYIDTIEQVNEYLNNSTLPTGSEYVVTDEDVVNRNNISSDKTNVKIYVRSSNTALANRYNVQHTININFDESYGYSIYQIWINNENVLDSNEKVNSSYYKWLITNSTEIKVIYKKICLVSQ